MRFIPDISFNFTGIVLLIFCLSIGIQLFYLVVFNLRLLLFKTKSMEMVSEPVSVIICARNEEDNIFKNLPLILEQDYPVFEVIIVNDQSIDDSRHIINAYQDKYKNLKLIELEWNRHRKFGKKVPLTIGIKGAQYNHLVMIDADCYPNSTVWLQSIMQNYTASKEIVIGYGPYQKRKGFLNKIIRFDTTAIASNYLSFAIAGRPYMGVGRNMSYLKSLFFEVDGFKNHYYIQSGDDDLFMQDAATKTNVAIELRPESFVYSEPKETWRGWVKQKQRHYSTAPKYKLINKLFLGIFPSTMFLMLFSFFILLFNSDWHLFIGVLLGTRFLFYWIVNGLLFRRLQMGDLVSIYPVFELIHFFMMPFIYYSAERREPTKW